MGEPKQRGGKREGAGSPSLALLGRNVLEAFGPYARAFNGDAELVAVIIEQARLLERSRRELSDFLTAWDGFTAKQRVRKLGLNYALKESGLDRADFLRAVAPAVRAVALERLTGPLDRAAAEVMGRDAEPEEGRMSIDDVLGAPALVDELPEPEEVPLVASVEVPLAETRKGVEPPDLESMGIRISYGGGDLEEPAAPFVQPAGEIGPEESTWDSNGWPKVEAVSYPEAVRAFRFAGEEVESPVDSSVE